MPRWRSTVSQPAGSRSDCDHIDALALVNGGSDVSPGRLPLLPQQIIAMGWMSPLVLRTR